MTGTVPQNREMCQALLAKGGVYARIFELQQDEVDALLDTGGAQPA